MISPLPYLSPPKIYQVNGVVTPLQTAFFSATVANNQQVIAGASGKIIRVMGWKIYALSTTQSSVTLKDASGGTTKAAVVCPTNAVGPDYWPVIESGYFELTTGNGLFVDIATTASNIHVFYITYTP